MPWSGTVEEQRRRFIEEFTAPGANRSEVCARWDLSRQAGYGGWISYRGREWRISKALHGLPVAIRATERDGDMAVYFCRQRVAALDLEAGSVRLDRG